MDSSDGTWVLDVVESVQELKSGVINTDLQDHHSTNHLNQLLQIQIKTSAIYLTYLKIFKNNFTNKDEICISSNYLILLVFECLSFLYYFETQMSQDQTLQHTIARQEIKPKKVLEEIEVSKQQSIQNDSKVQDNARKSVAKSNSQNSLGNVNLADSILPEPNQSGQSELKKQQQNQVAKIADDFYYDDKHEEVIHPDSPITQGVVKLDGFYGHDSYKRYNALVLDRDCIIYSAGISYIIFNHFTKDKKTFYSKDRGGIGSIAVHPSKKFFAVAEMGQWPNIYIYEYPSLRLYRVLRKGTERSYSSVTFSGSGDMLASVGSDPDYLLTVWDWKQQRLLLKSKAFSQQVYRVTFSQFNQKWLTTSGTGHIRFWKISQTFTGLKLQGDIAKFGQFELSDVTSYAQYEDGNVLSSSEYGKLLLWQGNVIKSVVSISVDKPCHNGQIQFVRNYKKKIISAGSDGYIRFWDAQAINQGESDEHFNFYIKPQKQIYFQTEYKKPAHINWIEIQEDYWIVQDALGSLWKYYLQSDKRQLIYTFNSGKINDFSISPLNNCLVSAGNDGFIRLWDYGNRRQFYNRRFATTGQATCIEWLPFSKKNNGRVLVVGFSDGIVRFVGLEQKKFTLIKAFKVHKNSINKVKCNREGNIVVVSDISGALFFLSLDSSHLEKITPYCLFETGFKINDLCWQRTGEKVLLACQDGKLHQIQTPKQKDCDYSQSYLHKFKHRTFVIKMLQSQKPNKQERQLQLLLMKTKGVAVDNIVLDQEWQPAPILNATYYTDSNKILCSVQGKYLGYLYIVDFNKERPINAIQIPKLRTSYLHYSQSSDIIFIGYRNGTWQMRHKYEPANFLRKFCFDQNYGIVRKLALNIQNTAVISASEDGTLLVHKIDFSSFTRGVKGEYFESSQISIPSVILGISSANFSDKIDFGLETQKDIQDNTIYCLQDDKLKAEQDMKLSDAQKIKRKKYQKIKQLQATFKEIVQFNKNQTDHLARLTPEEMVVDPEYAQAFQKRIDEEEQETRKQLAWDEAYAETKKNKLQNYFINVLQFNKFNVKGINKPIVVSSFKMNKLTSYIKRELQSIQKIIQQEQLSSVGDKRDKTVTSFEMSKAMLQMKLKDQKKGKQQNQEVKNKIKQAQNQFEKQLANAIATKGDYKLKCSPDYVVPQNQRLNVSRKKKHLFLHYQYLFEEKKQFNTRLDKLRLKKKQLVQKLQPTNQKLRKINRQLGIQENDIYFEIDQDLELLQTQFEVTEEDIQEHILQKQKEKEASKKTTGMGMAAGNQEKDKKDNEGQKIKKPKKKKVVQKKQEKNVIQIKPRANLKVKKSALQEELRQIKRIKLEAEKSQIKQQLFKQIQAFDNELQNLKNIKYQLQSDLNLVQMKILTYSQEFIIFRDMQTYDMQLMEQLKTFGADKNNLEATFLQLTTQIGEIQVLNQEFKKKYDQQKKILRQFVYPDDDQMRQRIIRYYKIRERKRINKLKKQAQIEQKQKESQGEQQEDEQEEQQEQSQESQDQFEDQDQKPDITVIENDHKNFERVRKICEYDEKIQQYSRKKSELQKQRNQINTKIKNISQSLSNAQKELKAYQKKKLLKINQVLVTLPVSYSQVEYTVKMGNKSRMQEQFNNAILFTRSSYNRLGDRIYQLERQTADICKKETNLKKKLKKLNDEVQKASVTIQSKRKQYEQKQLLKFGNTFEMDKLKQLEPNEQVLQMRQTYKKQERQVSKRIQAIKEQLQEQKRQLLQAKKQNTKVINDITELGQRQNELKKKLDSTNKQLFKNYDVSKKDELDKQRQNLKDLIKFLSKEIEDLKTQIGLFKRKGGHIYTMVTSNKKNFS